MATPIIMPKQGNTVESCLIVEWKKQTGEQVEAGEPLLEIETDKALIEVESPASGILLETFFGTGDEVPVQTTIAVIGQAGEATAEFAPEVAGAPVTTANEGAGVATGPAPSGPAAAAPGDPTPVVTVAGQAPVSPRARALAARHGLDPSALHGTGPGGRIIERDVTQALALQPARPATIAAAPPPDQDAILAQLPAATEVTPITLTGVRRRTAARMLASLQETAQLTLGRHAEASALLAMRQRLKRSPEHLGVADITINDLVLFAVARSLQQHPELNALFVGDTIYQLQEVHLGFAVDTPRGLLVPVLHHAQQLSLKALSQRAKTLTAQARDGHIPPEALQGGSFTVTNLGTLGIEQFTPILNPPQVAILGVCAITLRAVEEAGEIVHRPHLGLSLTINHQVVDGAPGARFLQTLAELLAIPEQLLLA